MLYVNQDDSADEGPGCEGDGGCLAVENPCSLWGSICHMGQWGEGTVDVESAEPQCPHVLVAAIGPLTQLCLSRGSSPRGSLVPRTPVAMAAGTFDGHGWEGAAGISGGEDKDAAKHPTMCGVPTPNNHLASNVCHVGVENPCSKVQYLERSQAVGTIGPLWRGLLCVQGRDGIGAVRLQGPGLGGAKLFSDARSGVHSVLVW